MSIADTDNGRTLRRRNVGGGEFQEFVSARQESKENSPIITDRYLLQRAIITTGAGTLPKAIRGSVGLTLAYPRAVFDHTGMISLSSDLFAFLMGPLTGTQPATLAATLGRLFDGET